MFEPDFLNKKIKGSNNNPKRLIPTNNGKGNKVPAASIKHPHKNINGERITRNKKLPLITRVSLRAEHEQ